MKLAVAGTGYVGLVAGVCFAEKGHTVTCVDVDEQKIAHMRSGISPIYEAGLEELLKRNIAENRLFFTSDFQSAYSDADAIFIGGGVTREGVLDTCWQQLKPGGRLVANAVTLQSELHLMNWRALHGGELTRLHVAHARPLGEFDTWRQALPITLLDVTKPLDA